MERKYVPAIIEFDLFFGFMFYYRNRLTPNSSSIHIKSECLLDVETDKLYLISDKRRTDTVDLETRDARVLQKRFGEGYAHEIADMIKQSVTGASIIRTIGGYTFSKRDIRPINTKTIRLTPIGLSNVKITPIEVYSCGKNNAIDCDDMVDAIIQPEQIVQYDFMF